MTGINYTDYDLLGRALQMYEREISKTYAMAPKKGPHAARDFCKEELRHLRELNQRFHYRPVPETEARDILTEELNRFLEKGYREDTTAQSPMAQLAEWLEDQE